MYFRRYRNQMHARQRRHRSAGVVAFAVAVLAMCVAVSWFLGKLSTQIAVSDATDIVTKAVNDSINEVIGQGIYGFDYFVNLDKDSDGSVTAITSNMAHINTLSTDILNSVIESTDNGVINVGIPFGNLTGLNLFATRSFHAALIRQNINLCLKSR